MALVPLYDENASDGSHHVRAPGGYESWRVVAYDVKQDLLLYAAVHEGFQSDPFYIRAYRQYLRNPTRRPPPVAQDYRWEELAVYHRRKRLAHSLKPIASPPIPISSASQLHVGGCMLNFDTRPPQSSLDASTFNSSHHWLFSNPLALLSGRLELKSAQFDFDGIPVCRDHRYGPALPRPMYIIDGVAFLPDSAIFFLATPTTSWIFRAGSEGIHLIDQPMTVQYPRQRLSGSGSSLRITLGDAFTLSRGTAIDASRAGSRHFFDPEPNEAIHGFCEYLSPRRRRWPLEVNWFSERPECAQPLLTLSPPPPADKSCPSPPGHARGPSSSPCSQNPERT